MMSKMNITKLLNFSKGKLHLLVIMLFFDIAAVLFAIVAPKIIGAATDEIVNAGNAKIKFGIFNLNYSILIKYIIICLTLYIISLIAGIVTSYLMGQFYSFIVYNMKNAVFDKINKLPISYFERRKRGEIISSFTNDFDKIDEFMYEVGTEIFSNILTISLSLIIMFSISFWMTFAILIISPITIFLTRFILKKSKQYTKNRQRIIADVNSTVEEAFTSHDMIRSYGLEEYMQKRLCEDNDKLMQANQKSVFLSIIVYPITSIMNNLCYIIVIFIGAFFAINNVITVGNIQSFIIYLRGFNGRVSYLSSMANIFQSAEVAMGRINALLEEKEDFDGELNSDIEFNESIKFSNVKFSYDGENRILNNINMTINKGEKIALVGQTGGGKSTITKVLTRYYEISEGSITIDGKNIENYKKDKVKNLFSIVLQDSWLFSGTIMENIRYGNPSATDEEVIRASKIAYSHDFIIKLKNGYQTVINDGSDNISQGQKQLITIARAILKNSPIIILDEATGSVDTRTEKYLQASMDNLMKGRTSIVVAHRLSTIFNADRIFVINKGEIVEEGNHTELLANRGYYFNLYTKITEA